LTGTSGPREPAAPDRRELWAWAFYDFANSPFATSILAVVFNVYFAGVVASAAPVKGVTLWSILVATSTLISAGLSPYLGAVADLTGRRKWGLTVTAIAGASATSSLVIAAPGTWILTSALFVVASVCFTLSLTFYSSFLNDLSTRSTIGWVSGFGWAIGYLGGGLCLAINLVMIRFPETFHIPLDSHWPIRLTFLSVGAWWMIFTVPVLIFLREPPGPPRATARTGSIWREAWKRVLVTIREARRLRKNLFRFLISYMLYNDVIETVIVVAAIFASSELRMSQSDIVSCFLLIQFVAFAGALGFGRAADRWSNIRTIQAAIAAWAVVLVWTVFMTRPEEFWAAGCVIGLILGGTQAISRSFFGRMIPEDEKAQFYGFYGLSGKISAAAGPLLFGLVHEWTSSFRWAIVSLTILLMFGFLILTGVEEPDADGR